MVTKLKSEEYGGRTIIFVKGRGGMIFAQSPAITSQYIGVGRTKELAFEDAKIIIDNFNDINKKIKIIDNYFCIFNRAFRN